jgi:hypothetical protein
MKLNESLIFARFNTLSNIFQDLNSHSGGLEDCGKVISQRLKNEGGFWIGA